MGQIGFRQYLNGNCFSYLIWDQSTKEGMLVDPVTECLGEYRSELAQEHLELKFIIDTHTHEDHFSGSLLLREQFKCDIVMSHLTESERVTRKVRDGEILNLGSVPFTIFETPGHSLDSIVLHFLSEKFAFVGDTILPGKTGACDCPSSDPVALFNSLAKISKKLSADTIIFSSHDSDGCLFSTIEVEENKNNHFLLKNSEAFIKLKKAESSGAFSQNAQDAKIRYNYNLSLSPAFTPEGVFGGAVLRSRPADFSKNRDYGSISIEKYFNKVKEGSSESLFIDVRETSEFSAKYIDGHINVPLSLLAFRLEELRKAKSVYLICASGRRSALAAKTLSYLGIHNPINVLGGMHKWRA